MPNQTNKYIFNRRSRWHVDPLDVAKVICHRLKDGVEEYLIQWNTVSTLGPEKDSQAICSWHGLSELQDALHHVQEYIESRVQPSTSSKPMLHVLLNRKRKSPSSDPLLSRDGLMTPQDSTHLSREASVISINSTSDIHEGSRKDLRVYNGILERKEGRIVAKNFRRANISRTNFYELPTLAMLEAAKIAPVKTAERFIREAFFQKLKAVPKVGLQNDIDSSTPSLNFTFINEFVLRDGVCRADPETNEGCTLPCKPNMGQSIGCEYAKLCRCLEYAAVDERKLERTDLETYQRYMRARQRGDFIDTRGFPKRFPYEKPNVDARIPPTLQTFYREERHPIYECNSLCNCGPRCKSRVVQKGRHVGLTIFKTHSRGWGVYCDEDLVKGEFIDTYLGEVITNDEADRREAVGGKGKSSYLYSLDKFAGDGEALKEEDCFVVDGQYMGSVTRFINHSCEPNCRQYTVSYNRHDQRIYDLAFFAYDDIPRGTELTFDYMDKDEEEEEDEEDVFRQREEAANDLQDRYKVPCNCGTTKCRGYLWV